MKKYLILLLFLSIAGIAAAQNKDYRAADAAKHIGESIVVTDTVKGYKVIREGFYFTGPRCQVSKSINDSCVERR